MKTIRVVIVDDEEKAIDSLSTILLKFCTDIEIVGTANSACAGIELINRVVPDIAFIDIQMPDATGFDVVNSLKNDKIITIFVTAYNQYAVRAFNVNVIGYLLKPVDIEEVQNVVEKAKKMICNFAILQEITERKPQIEKLSVPTGKGILFIEPENILYIEADGSYSTIHYVNGENVFVSKNLGELEELLGVDTFFRTHHSFIINLKHVCELNNKEGGYVILTGGKKVLLSRRKKMEFLKIFES